MKFFLNFCGDNMYITNPHVFMYPCVTGNKNDIKTKFVLFNPDNRRRFEVPIEGSIPRIIDLMLFCSEVPRSEKELTEKSLIADLDELRSLVDSRIITNAMEPINREIDYLYLYQRLVHNYPFGDYNIPKTIDEENALMDSYAEFYDPPPSYFERLGVSYEMPDVTEHSKKPSDFSIDMAKILNYTFGSFGLLRGRHGRFFHKTSPSGGARHPTEAIVVINSNLNQVPPGVYSYDFLKRTLIDSETLEMKTLLTEKFKNCKAAIILRSRVERPMWRYRDPRSYRPAIIDAGHLIENAKLLIEDMGYSAYLTSPFFIADSQGEWLKEPFLAAIAINPENGFATTHVESFSPLDLSGLNENFVINPASFYTIKQGSMVAHTLFPYVYKENIPYKNLETIFLSREKKLEIGKDKFLKEKNFIIPYSFALPLLEGFSIWGNHDWDLSLLAYLATSNNQIDMKKSIEEREDRSLNSSSLGLSENLIDVMLRRHTDRGLTGEGVDRKILENLLSCAITKELISNDIDVFLVCFSVSDLEQGVYQWSNGLIKKTNLPDRQDLRSATIGQTWASHGSTSIILSYNVASNSPETYNAALIRLGMLGQRICLKSTSLDLGSFMTPALNDRDVARILDIANDCMDRIFYLIDIGTSRMSVSHKAKPIIEM